MRLRHFQSGQSSTAAYGVHSTSTQSLEKPDKTATRKGQRILNTAQLGNRNQLVDPFP